MPRIATSAASAAIALLIIVGSSASTAAADPGTDGFWYFDLPHIQDIHDDGITGEGVVIAVVDDQINLEVPTLQGADIEVQPSFCWDDDGVQIPATSTELSADHGTNIVSYLVGTGAGYPGQTGVKGVAPGAKVLFFSAGRGEVGSQGIVCNPEPGKAVYEDWNGMGQGIFEAAEAGADIISVSLINQAMTYVKQAVIYAMSKGAVVISGVRNDSPLDPGAQFFTGFPAAYNGVVAVQAADSNVVTMENHTDPFTTVAAPGVQVVWQGDSTWEEQRYARGTSIATPIVAGFLALVADKYPDATANQLIQTLIRNTGVEDHELVYDPENHVGYGSASATHMLRVDPTQYDDVNPLLLDNGFDPTPEEVKNPVGREYWDPDYVPTDVEPTDPGTSPQPAGPAPVLLLAVVGGGVLLVGILATVIIVLATRRGRANRTPPAA